METQNFIVPNVEHYEELVVDNTIYEPEQTESFVLEPAPSSVKSKPKTKVCYKCNLCNYTTDRTTNFNMHYKMVHLKTRVMCHLCGKEYSNINQHLRIIHKVLKSGMTEKHRCEHCGQEFYDLEQHLRRAHSNLYVGRDCSCNICGENFS